MSSSTSRSSTSATSDDDATGRKSESAAAATENGARTPRADASERATRLIASGLLPIRRDALAKDDAIVDAPTSAAKTYEGASRGQDRDRLGESLRAIKRRKAESRAKDLCRYTVQGVTCRLGKRCGYTHDIDAYRKSKPSDIKGSPCVFVNASSKKCPFGVRCRFESSHAKLTKMKSEHQVEFAVNLLDDSMQKRLRKNEYPFPRSDSELRAANLELKCLSFAQKAKVDRRQGYLGASEPGGAHKREHGTRLSFKHKIYVAPLTTVGNLPFRRICTDLGADITVSEMAMASNLLKGDRKEWALLRRHPSEKCFGIQVCGGYPDLMSRCAELIDNEISCDFIDVNMGCPIDGVCAKGAGSSLMRDTDRLKNVVRTMTGVSSTPVTIKLRMGYFDDPSRYVAHDIIPRAKKWGAFAATLHGRTREQRYSRLADWSYIHRCADVAVANDLPLIGNGDVYTYEDYNAQVADSKLATCMIG